MKDSAILRTAKVGGFNKEDVLTYVDELNSKIDSLKSELEKTQTVQADVSELENYKSEIERLKEKLSETEIKLSEVRVGSDAARSELENEKNAISEENYNLKNEIESLKYQLEEAQNSVPAGSGENAHTVDTSVFENEISELKIQLENAKGQISEMSGEMTKLTSDIAEKAKKIEQLTLDNNELRLQNDDSSFSGNFDMGALFSEAQATAKKIVVEARMAADKLVRDAQSESDRLIKDAESKAESINAEALGKAAMLEADVKKNAQFAIESAERLKNIFRSEIEALNAEFTATAENIEYMAKKLVSGIDEAKNSISENVNNFLDGKTGLNTAVGEFDSISQKNLSESEKEKPCEYIQNVNIPETDKAEDSDPYISFDNFDKTAEENIIGNKSNESEIDDILSSFAIDPVSDEEPLPSMKPNPSLGFDLGDLAKLAEEAEKEM